MIPLKQISYSNSNNSICGHASNVNNNKKFKLQSMTVLDNLRLRGGAGKNSSTSIVPQTSICRQIVYTPGGSCGYQCQPFLMCGPQMPFQSCPPIIFNISSCPKHASASCCVEKTGSKMSLRKRKSTKRSSRSPKGSKKRMQTSSSHSQTSHVSGASLASQGSKEIIHSKGQKPASPGYFFDTQSTQYNSMESLHGAKPEYKQLTVEPIKESEVPSLTGNRSRKSPSNVPSFINPEVPGYHPDLSPGMFPNIRVDLFGAKEKSPKTPIQSAPPNLTTTKGNVSRTSPIQPSVITNASPSFVSPGPPQWHSSKIPGSHNAPAFPEQSPKFVSLESGSAFSQSSSHAASQKFSSQLSEQGSNVDLMEQLKNMNHQFKIEAQAILNGIKAFQQQRRMALQ